ncbi:MAG TPA: hypothetical protein VMI31_09570 [Fimbriimonadaceae bacterium]|nr:hypothetical protein [Fimbriimonadaceae bacterium]
MGKTTKPAESPKEARNSSPAGQNEVDEHTAKELKGNDEVPAKQPRKRNPPVHRRDANDPNPKDTRPKPRTP